jgi:hypothetical protein
VQQWFYFGQSGARQVFIAINLFLTWDEIQWLQPEANRYTRRSKSHAPTAVSDSQLIW